MDLQQVAQEVAAGGLGAHEYPLITTLLHSDATIHAPRGRTATRYPLPATRYPLPATRYPLPATRYPLPATRYPLSAGRGPR
jgi:hypothetical protein